MSQGGKKGKLLIKPFKHVVQMDPNYAQVLIPLISKKTWALLEGAIHEIHKQNASCLSFEELYRNAYNMVLHKYGDVLYKGLKDVVSNHLTGIADGVCSAVDENFLPALEKAWSDHKISMLMIRDILMYMDRVYVQLKNVSSVYDLGLELFRDKIARNPRIKDRLLDCMLDMIRRERHGEVVERGQLRSMTQMLIDLGVNSRAVYEEDFEKRFLEESDRFYTAEAQAFLEANNCADYMKKVAQRLKEELERVEHYLDKSTEPKIKAVCEDQLIARHKKTLVDMDNSGLVPMLRDDKVEDLNRMFSLFGRISDGLTLMRDTLYEYVRDTGRNIVNDAEKDKEQNTYVEPLLALKDKYDRLLAAAFTNDKQFQHSINQAFEFFINVNPKSPEYLSLFIDNMLKKGLKGVSEDEVDATLDKVMVLFRFIQDKDLFEKYYKQHLAKRLLLGRSVSDDAERNMIGKLKQECGYQFTSKLEGMFTDMKLSADTMANFKLSLAHSNPLRLDLNVQVLTTGYWPTQSTSPCNLPNEIVTCCEVFKKFYLNSHSGRRLTWQTNMGSAEIRAQFKAKRHELSVSTFQMCVLLLFNDKTKFSYREILETTNIPILDLKRNLLTLSCAKYKILRKEPAGKTIEDTDVFVFNEAFKAKFVKVKVMTVVQKESEAQAKVTRERVDEDRKHQIEAAVVRVMKARKTMDHTNLVAEVTKQLAARFLPNPVIIKKRIESLIEREYLARSNEDRKIYTYLA